MRVAVAPGRRLFVDIDGAGWVADGPALRQRPTLLLLHGGPGFDHSSYKPLFAELADIAQVVWVDHRGHGRSDACPLAEITLDTLADDVVRLCEALDIEHPVVLGQSFGGFVAQRYLARHPQHPARVVLSSTSAQMNLARKLLVFERLGGAAAREAARSFWTQPDAATWADYSRLCRPLYNRTPADPHAAARGLHRDDILFHWSATEMPAMDLRPGLAAVRCPVLVLAGDDDPVCPLDDAQDIVAALPPRWRSVRRFAGCGHGVWRDDAPAALAVLRAFVQGRPLPG